MREIEPSEVMSQISTDLGKSAGFKKGWIESSPLKVVEHREEVLHLQIIVVSAQRFQVIHGW